MLWVVNPDGSVEFITSPDSSPTVRREPGYAAEALAVGDIGVWALGERIDPAGARSGGYVWRVDGPTAAPSSPVPVEAASTMGLAVGGGAVWVADPVDGRVHRIRPDPINSTVTVDRGVDSLSFDAGRLWAANSVTGELWTIDPASERRTRVSTTGRAVGVEARFSVAAAVSLAPALRVASSAQQSPGGTPSPMLAVETAAGRQPDVILVGDVPVGTANGDADVRRR